MFCLLEVRYCSRGGRLEARQIDHLWRHKSNMGDSNTNFCHLRESYLKENSDCIVWKTKGTSSCFNFNLNYTKTKLFWNFVRSRPPNKIWAWKITTKQDDILFTSVKLSDVSIPVSSCDASKTFSYISQGTQTLKTNSETCRSGIHLALI